MRKTNKEAIIQELGFLAALSLCTLILISGGLYLLRVWTSTVTFYTVIIGALIGLFIGLVAGYVFRIQWEEMDDDRY